MTEGIPGEMFAVSIDDFAEGVFDWLESHQDGGAGHYARFDAKTLDAAADRLLDGLRPFVVGLMYASDDYGDPLEAEEGEDGCRSN